MAQLRDNTAISVLSMNVRKYRLLREMTQEGLANAAGMEYSQVSRIERGLLNTSVSVVFALARALDVRPELLLESTG